MIVTFQQIKRSVFDALNIKEENIDAETVRAIELRINQVQDMIFFDRLWEWRRATVYRTTNPPYETGTIAVTQGSTTVTGSGTTWIDDHKEGFVLINGKAYKVRRVASATSLRLEAPYPDDTATGVVYKIIFPNYTAPSVISAIDSIFYAGGQEITIKDQSQIPLDYTVGSPSVAAFTGRRLEEFYSTGTVSVTQGSTTVTGSSTVWTQSMEGKVFRVNEFAEPYIIREFSSATSFTLDRPYQGDTGSGKQYKIDPEGQPVYSIRNVPDDYYFMEIKGFLAPRKLVNNNDISLIPNHAPLLHGAIWLAACDFEDRNPVRIQQARSDFERTIKQLRDSYKSSAAAKWMSEAEVSARKTASSTFNPLAD